MIIVKKNEKTVGTLYTRLKDRTQNILKSDVIYKLDCKDCDKTYIGHTSQTLKARIAGHKSDSRHNRQRCMLAVHVNENDHHINYEDANVIATERNYKKRIFLEMFYITTTEDTMNKKSDVEQLSNIYTYIINKGNQRSNDYHSLFERAITF